MSREHVQAAFERWHQAATAGADLLVAIRGISAPDAVFHLQNGEDGDAASTDEQAAQARALYPDLAIEIEHVVTTEDRLLVQVTLSGAPALVFQIARGRRRFHAVGAVVARVNEHAELTEVWAYINPAAMLAFPPQSRNALAPTPLAQPGTEEDAAGVKQDWARAATGREFLERILASAAPDCIVHATNADIGGLALLEAQFHVVHSAFPDLTVSFEAGFVVGDRLVSQFTFDGIQRGWLAIAPPRGSRVQSRGAIVARVGEDRRIFEMWVYLASGMGLIFSRRDQAPQQ